MADKIVEGRMAKFYEEVCLYEQPFVKENTITIDQLIKTKIAKLGENISVSRFARFKVGDELQISAKQRRKTTSSGPKYDRILLKLSGEAMAGPLSFGIDPERVKDLASEIAAIAQQACRSAWWWAAATSSAASRSRPRTWIASPAITWACSPR